MSFSYFLLSVVTIRSCLSQAAPETDHFDRVIDVSNNYEGSNYTLNVKSTAYSSTDELLSVSISTINGRCRNPKLSLSFEEIDFDQEEEYFEVYFSSVTDAARIANCSGRYRECDVFTQCIDGYPLPVNTSDTVLDIFILKSAAVNPFCSGYSMNVNLTIECAAELYHEWHTLKDAAPAGIYGHIAVYHNHTWTLIGGVTDNSNRSDGSGWNAYIYSRVVAPYDDDDALDGELAFASLSSSSSSSSQSDLWQSRVLTLPSSVYAYSGFNCDGQCYTQLHSDVYMFGAFNLHGDGGYGVLLRYELSTATWSYRMSDMRLNHACVANNDTHILIVGGVDEKSKVAYHNIQSYDISGDAWQTNAQSLYVPRSDAGCGVVHNILYVVGGWIDDGAQATDSIETVALATMQSQLLSTVLQDARAEHQVLVDNDARLWIMGGRCARGIAMHNIEILDTITLEMLSTQNAVQYASTARHALWSAAWFDAENAIMFVSGGKWDQYNSSMSRDIQYLDTNVLGTNAFPTPPPTMPPVPTPFPTPVGHLIGYNRTYDMSGYSANDSVTFTQTIQSSEELSTDSFFYVNFRVIHGMCRNASLSLQFEEIDFADSANEYIDVFYPHYPSDLIAHCTGSHDWNCGQWLSCVSDLALTTPVMDATDASYNYAIAVTKAPEVNAYCSGLSMNARVSLHCGPKPPPTETPTLEPTRSPSTPAPTSLYSNISRSFDLSAYAANETVSFTIAVQSAIDNGLDTFFNTRFLFENGSCSNPRLTFLFEEVDFAEANEFIELYYESYPSTLIQRCLGADDGNCGHFVNCTDTRLLSTNATDAISIILLKSAQVNSYFCEYALNANVTITCGPIAVTEDTNSTDTMADTSVTQQFDLVGHAENETLSFVIPIQSSVDDGTDVLFKAEFVFLNGQCQSPLLTFDFEEIDFAQSYEYIDVYFPSYSPSDFIARCQGTADRNCGTSLRCLDLQPLASNGTTTNTTTAVDSITIWLLKSSEVNEFCDYSFNVNVTIHCGPFPPTLSPSVSPSWTPTLAPTPARLNFSHTFDLSLRDDDEDDSKLFHSYTQNIASTVDENQEAILNVTFQFINGVCSAPYLSIAFEEIDFAEHDEYLEIRYPSKAAYDAIAQCQGDADYNCGHWEQCLSFYDLAVFNVSDIDEITLFIVKSGEVNAFCSNSVNVNVTIACVTQQMVTCPPTPICTPVPISITTPPSSPPSSPPTSTVDCGNATGTTGTASATDTTSESEDKLMTYLPWILFAVSLFGNVLLLIVVIKTRKGAASFGSRRRADVTQMVSMQSRAGLMDNFGDFQEVTSDASVDYVNINA